MKKTYDIPMFASFSIILTVEADSLDDAVTMAGVAPLPDCGDWDYIDGSFEVDDSVHDDYPEDEEVDV